MLAQQAIRESVHFQANDTTWNHNNMNPQRRRKSGNAARIGLDLPSQDPRQSRTLSREHSQKRLIGLDGRIDPRLVPPHHKIGFDYPTNPSSQEYSRSTALSVRRSNSVALDFHLDEFYDKNVRSNLPITNEASVRMRSSTMPSLSELPECGSDSASIAKGDWNGTGDSQSELSGMARILPRGVTMMLNRFRDTAAPTDTISNKTAFESKSEIRARNAGLIHPRNSRKFLFDILIFIAILYLMFLVPLDVVMDVEPFNINSLLFWISRLLDTMFIFDLILNFFTAVDGGDGIAMIVDKHVIAMRYLRGWFWIDLISSIPFDLILWIASGAPQTQDHSTNYFRTTRLLRFSKIIRVLKILRVMRLQRLHLKDSTEASGLGGNPQFQMALDGGKYIAGIIYCAHWLTCIFIFILMEENAIDHKVMLLENATERYIAALYFTFTYLTTIGFGDIVAESPSQRIFMIFGLTMGSFTTTYFMSVIISLVVTKNQEKTKKRLLMNRIEEYMLYRRFPDGLKRNIREYVRLVNNNTFTDETAILRALSPELRKKCSVYKYGTFLRTIPFLQTMDNRMNSRHFIEELALQMSTVYFAADDLIARKNDFDDRCWFIELGSCKIFHSLSDERKRFKVLEAGDRFGETALISNSFVIDYYVRAISWTGMIVLHHDQFAEILALYPAARTHISSWLHHNRNKKLVHSTVTFAVVLDEMSVLTEQDKYEVMAEAPDIQLVTNFARTQTISRMTQTDESRMNPMTPVSHYVKEESPSVDLEGTTLSELEVI